RCNWRKRHEERPDLRVGGPACQRTFRPALADVPHAPTCTRLRVEARRRNLPCSEGALMRISDHGDLDLIPFDNDPELVKWARYGIDQLKRENAARNAYEQAERDYHHHNRTLDGQA